MIFTTSLLLSLAGGAQAHIALFHPSMFGLLGDRPYQQTNDSSEYQNNAPVNPLRQFDNLTEEQWFAHGRKKYPPPEGVFMELPAGGSFIGELNCDRAMTTMGWPKDLERNKASMYVCERDMIPQNKGYGPVHNVQRKDQPIDTKYFGGTALAIAYTSDIDALKPSDMTVFSVNLTSPWYRETEYKVPADLPACPEGGCLCSWNWLHRAEYGEGYGSEMYNNVYRCNVTGATSNNELPLGAGQVPKECESNPADCVKGPKQPIYVWQKTGNNVEKQPGKKYPTYTMEYGFADGAQTDLFTAGKKRMTFEE